MAVTKVSLTGRVEGDGTISTYTNNNELFLKVFANEVLQTFQQTTVMLDKHMVRTISSGKSAQFPVMGVAGAAYHKPGDDIAENGSYLQAIKHDEIVITIDDLLIATTFIDRLDEMKNHYDVRSVYSQELGRALARTMDKNLLGVGILGAATFEAAAPTERVGTMSLSGFTTSAQVIQDNDLGAAGSPDIPISGADDFVEAMFKAAAGMDVRGVPPEDRYVVLTPTSYYNILNSADGRNILNRDFGAEVGSYQAGTFPTIAGFNVVKSQIATTVFGTNVSVVGSGAGDAFVAGTHDGGYGANFTRVKALFFHRSGIGTVKLMDISVESEYDMRLQGHLMLAKYACGHKYLRPESLGILVGAA